MGLVEPPRRATDDLRPRSTAALVVSRADAAPLPAPSAPAHRFEYLRRWLPLRRASAARRVDREPAIWPTVLTWVLLGSAIAALWALLLLGDSLAPTVR